MDAENAEKNFASAAKCVAIKMLKYVTAVINAIIDHNTVPAADIAGKRKNPANVWMISAIYAGSQRNQHPACVVSAAEAGALC